MVPDEPILERQPDKCPGCIEGDVEYRGKSHRIHVRKHDYASGEWYSSVEYQIAGRSSCYRFHYGKCLRCGKVISFYRKKYGQKPVGRYRPLPVEKGKCIADQVKIYMNYVFDSLKFEDYERQDALEIYANHVRGEPNLTTSANPRILASAICYIAGVRARSPRGPWSERGYPASMRQIAELMGVTEVAIRQNCAKVKSLL